MVHINWNIAFNGTNRLLHFPQLWGNIFGRLEFLYQGIEFGHRITGEHPEERKYTSLEDRSLGEDLKTDLLR